VGCLFLFAGITNIFYIDKNRCSLYSQKMGYFDRQSAAFVYSIVFSDSHEQNGPQALPRFSKYLDP